MSQIYRLFWFCVCFAPTTAENTYSKYSQISHTHICCNQHNYIPFWKDCQTNINNTSYCAHEAQNIFEKKSPITTKRYSRLESNYFFWSLLIMFSHINCYQLQIFSSKQCTPLHDKKLVDHSGFVKIKIIPQNLI